MYLHINGLVFNNSDGIIFMNLCLKICNLRVSHTQEAYIHAHIRTSTKSYTNRQTRIKTYTHYHTNTHIRSHTFAQTIKNAGLRAHTYKVII